jgi:O-antigen/teichoic acid export membrane protein
MIASFTGAVWGYALLSLRRHRAVLLCTALSLAVTVVATYAFTVADGAEGAAIGTTIAEWVYSLALGVAVFRGGVRPAVAWPALPRVAAAALIGAATLLVPGVPSVVRVLAAMVLYVVTLLGVRAVPPELLDHLPARLQALAR